MKKRSIKVMLASLLAIPVLALALPSVPAMAVGENCSGAGGAQQGANCAQGSNTPNTLFGPNSVFVTVVNTLLFVIGAVAVIMLVYGGIRYTISGGDQKAVTDAKNTILYAVIGIIVAVMAYAIVNFVLTSLSSGTGT
jgi:hypothetical protein